jgi:hypothetical protein
MAAALADELGLQIGKAEVVRPRLAARVVGEGGASGCLIFIWALLTPSRPRAALEIHGTRIRLWGIDGKKVMGVEDGIIFGGELTCWSADKTFPFGNATLDDAVAWLRAQHWKITDELVRELAKAVD